MGATEAALDKAIIVKKAKGYEAKISIEYSNLEPLKYYLDKMNIKITKIDYLEQIEITVDILEEHSNQFMNNYNNSNFKILKFDILQEKFVEI